jgi:hypothetical protein
MPPDAAGKEYHEFRQESITDFYRKVKEAIDNILPGIIFFGTTYHEKFSSMNLKNFCKYVDVVSREAQWGYGGSFPYPMPLSEVGLIALLMKNEVKKQIQGTTFIAKNVDYNYHQRSPSHLKLHFMEMLSQGSQVQAHTQNVFDPPNSDNSLLPVLSELFQCVKKVRPYLLNANILSYAALFNWAETKDVSNYFSESLRGYYRALIDYHIPVNIVNSDDILANVLYDYQVLVLPNAVNLSNQVIQKIQEYVEGGGGLVLTYQSGWCDEKGEKRERVGLAELAGIHEYFGTAASHRETNYPIYYRVVSEELIWKGLKGRLLSFGETSLSDRYVQIKAAKDAHVVAQILDLDYSRMHKEHWLKGAFPGKAVNPMIVTRKAVKGKVVYITGSLDSHSRRSGDPESIEVLVNAVLMASKGEPTIITNCPSSVHITTHIKQESVIIFLVNQTSNQLSLDPSTREEVIRYIVPINNVTIQIKLDRLQPKDVIALTGQHIEYDMKDSNLSIRFKELKEYEAILIKL